jgi:cytochrome d ubiquinol oxidase subunit I
VTHLAPLFLSRLQFAFTIAFHIIFPSFSIGLASFLAVLEGLFLATGKARYQTLYLFWIKIFALSFGMGVVSGVVMSYEFGTNWSVFAAKAANVIGPLMAFEVLSAFFLEASFLGVMLFGWKKVGRELHFAASCLVALGTLMSAVWIVSANSWMQSPSGYAVLPDGRFIATDWLKVIVSPTFPPRVVHMVLAAYLTTALVVGAASAWRLLKTPDQTESRTALKMAIGMFAVIAPLQLIAGHWSGEVVRERQPLKLAAIEAYWTTRTQQPLNLVGFPDRKAGATHMQVAIPRLGSAIDGVGPKTPIQGLSDWPRADWPVVWLVFWSFRVMFAVGMAIIGLGLWGAIAWARGRLFTDRWFLRAATLMGPAGFLAVVCGWVTAEAGRQPYTIYGLLRTSRSLSPVGAGEVSLSLASFIVIYAVVFTIGVLYILRLIVEGPDVGALEPVRPGRAPGTPLAGAPDQDPGEPLGGRGQVVGA